MAESGHGALSSAPLPTPPPNKPTADDTLTDSEIALTPEGGSSAGSAAAIEADATATGAASPIGSPQIGPEHAITDTPMLGPTSMSAPQSPQYGASRHPSFSGSSSYQEDWDIPPLDRLTMLDLLDNFALPQQLEKISKGISAQTRKLKKSRDAIKSRSQVARERMVEEWRHRVPSADEQLDRYRKRMRTSVEKLGRRWNDTKAITMREKVSFICGVLNIFVSGYLMGGMPEYMHLWYTVQILYFMPIRYFTYHKRGYHYFLADLCYFVNLLLLLSLWIFPGSKRLFVACYCLAFGNNAVAIIMWRNSLVFHSFDKVTSLFIHVMPCATLHCIVHLLQPEYQRERYPAVYAIRTALPGSDNAYANVLSMLAWSSIPYAFWQLSYYFFITVRRREKIAAGRPTSFTWLRQSYSKTWIGKIVLSLPDALQESAFMLIQYIYAVCTMLPCPLWFSYRWASSFFLMGVFTWSIYNGATYYIDVFGKRFQKELEAMRQEVAKWHAESVGGDSGSIGGGSTAVEGGQGKGDGSKPSPDVDGTHSNLTSPPLEPLSESGDNDDDDEHGHEHGRKGIDTIPLLDQEPTADEEEKNVPPSSKSPGITSAAEAMATATMTGADWDLGAKDVARKRN
ncbi:f-box protein [Ophiostoma piceae UAMH 11346]|uniref:Glycerophosphocholine acyltransferase 1 n=1 Tax=Ophiostoma piceae (strain UAMH 11346) TaxID=1262450 RepID=S3CBY1_OPHP1|nr:f-box protein [Ophiostoma piceae UAMH 11346]